MTPDGHQPTGAPGTPPHEPPHWEQRLEKALGWYIILLMSTAGLGLGMPFQLHPSAMLQRLASIVFVAAYVPFLPMSILLLYRPMRRNPPFNRLYAWGMRLLSASLLIFLPSFLWAYVGATGLLFGWHFSRMDLSVFIVIVMLTSILAIMGGILVFVAFIRDLWRLARSRRLSPPSGLRD